MCEEVRRRGDRPRVLILVVAGCVKPLLLIDVTYVIIALSAKSGPLSTCIWYFISCCIINLSFKISKKPSSSIRFWIHELVPLKGNLVLQTLTGSVAGCISTESPLFGHACRYADIGENHCNEWTTRQSFQAYLSSGSQLKKLYDF